MEGSPGRDDGKTRITKPGWQRRIDLSALYKNCGWEHSCWTATSSDSVSASYWLGDLGKVLDLSVFQLPHLLQGIRNNSMYLWGCYKAPVSLYTQCLLQCLMYRSTWVHPDLVFQEDCLPPAKFSSMCQGQSWFTHKKLDLEEPEPPTVWGRCECVFSIWPGNGGSRRGAVFPWLWAPAFEYVGIQVCISG